MWDRLERWTGLGRRRGAERRLALSQRGALIATLIVVLAVTILGHLVLSFVHLPRNLHLQQRCRMSRMWPSYVRHDPPSPAGLSTKYRLFLYRELPPGEQQKPPVGRPALFVPGNAGSYGQVRSVGSIAQHLFDRGEAGEGGKEVDWWSVDFNEDFSAFHGETMREQALYLNDAIAYLMQLYPDTKHIPILAHSMGGIVARLMLLQDNHPNGSVQTIVTLSSPHAYPPVPIDAGLEAIYAQIERESKASASQVLIISLSGGILDDQLSSEGSNLGLARILNAETSLYAFSSSLAALWSGVDHLAMMWCDQLRERIARGVLRIEAQDKALSIRREEWRRMLGMERASDIAHSALALGDTANKDTQQTFNGVRRKVYCLPAFESMHFELLTDLNVGLDTSFGPPIDQRADIRVDICDGASACTHVLPAAYDLLPPSPIVEDQGNTAFPTFPLADRRYELPGNSIRRLVISQDDLKRHGAVTIRVEKREDAVGFVHAGCSDEPGQRWYFSLPRPPTSYNVTLSNAQGTAPSREVIMSSIDSTLLAYNLLVVPADPRPDCEEKGSAPLLRIQSLSTGDIQYIPSLRTGAMYKLMLHGTSPFMPPAEPSSRGMKFTLFLDPCHHVDSLQVSVDWTTSMGLLLSRYRTALVAFPFATLLLITSVSWEQWDQGAPFAGVLPSLVTHMHIALPLLTLVSFFASIIQMSAYGLFSLEGNWLINDLVFGIPASHPAYHLGMTVLFTTLAYGLTILAAALLDALVGSLAVTIAYFTRHTLAKSKHNAESAQPPIRPGMITFVVLLILAIAIFAFVPIQFVFMILFVVQLFASSRSTAVFRRSAPEAQAQDLVNQHRLLLNITFWLMPLNAPVLLVWTRNLLNGWYGTLGNADHNVFKLFGFLAVGWISSGDAVIPRANSRLARLVTVLLTLRCALYAILYGIRYTYGLFGATNILFVWLAWLYMKPRLLRDHQHSSNEPNVAPEMETMIDEAALRHSTVPTDIAQATENALPESLVASLQENTGYSIDDSTRGRNVKPKKPSGPAQCTRMDSLLEEYLNVLDEYASARQLLSDVIARGSFQLSKARMQLARPYLTRSWDARMKASVGVQAGLDDTMRLRQIKVEPEGQTAYQDNDKRSGQVLRKRRGKDERADDIKAGVAQVEKTDEASEPAPFDPLYQFSALPPPSLRHAQSTFREMLSIAVGPEAEEKGWKSGKGLVNILNRLAELEEQIRKEQSRTSARPAKKEDDDDDDDVLRLSTSTAS